MKIEEDLEIFPEWENYIPKYTPNFFEIDWEQEVNPDYIAVRSENPTTYLSQLFNKAKSTLGSIFYSKAPKCPYGFK